MKKTSTKVTFRKFKHEDDGSGGDIIAVFPDMKCDVRGGLNSYMHLGQHCACSADIVLWTDPATEAEYGDLLQELRNVGYDDLKVVA